MDKSGPDLAYKQTCPAAGLSRQRYLERELLEAPGRVSCSVKPWTVTQHVPSCSAPPKIGEKGDSGMTSTSSEVPPSERLVSAIACLRCDNGVHME
ncbi:hypothetical protein B0T14DRAFT_530661 [Immersiella caudata]|uniref:Uncharacterized protein n=1 Tax=Immersiella caudata TaxID=314043 RepID=A0AA39WAB7_9PEZI|nr:hypothetical protein B0T14DRAFT_530661 [Immersiella caudata]